jgi:hypothetical protein
LVIRYMVRPFNSRRRQFWTGIIVPVIPSDDFGSGVGKVRDVIG